MSLKPSKMKNKFCNLCCALCDDLSGTLEGDAQELLTQLIPHLDVISWKYPQDVCMNCSTKIRGYLEFKSSFLQTQTCLGSFGAEQSSEQLDLKQVCLQNEGNGSEVGAKDFVVCRFCLKQTTSVRIPLLEDQKESVLVAIMMGKCFPGLELGSMSGYVICNPCHETLEVLYNFIRSLDVENRIKKEDMVHEMEFEEGPEVKTVLFEWGEFGNGNGCVDLNAVKEEDDWLTANRVDFNGGVEMTEVGGLGQVQEQKLKENKGDIEVAQLDGTRVRGRTSATKSERTYKCEHCAYDTSYKQNYNRHLMVHKSLLKKTKYVCTVCPYKSKVQANFTKHMLIHKESSKVAMYKCECCTYETRHKQSLVYHELSHKSALEVPVYKCKLCSYETKYKYSYTQHLLVHKKPSEVTMYKCKSCGYYTRHKRNLTTHELTHKEPSELTMFKCELCPYEAKIKGNLTNHMMVHRNPSQLAMFKCELCPYKTRLKANICKHMSVHKGPEEVDMFKCDACVFQTKHRSNLKRHVMSMHHIKGKV